VATNKKDRKRSKRRAMRVRSSIKKGDLPRVSVFRSHKNIYGQIIDDSKHQTVVSFASSQLEKHSGDKKEVAYAVGKELAQRAKAKGIDRVLFDRGAYKYHGRVKAFADGMRESGVTI
jgi:large subunit ribosomal protein L18